MGAQKKALSFRAALVAVCLLIPAVTLGQLSPSLQKALDWLSSQVQATLVMGEDAAVGTPVQTRAETVQTLKALGNLPGPLAQSVANSADLSGNPDTETLARRVLVGAQGAQDITQLILKLKARQNTDGGFGGAEGYRSHVLDTAWAALALAQAGEGAEAVAVKARQYLTGQVAADGGVTAASPSAGVVTGQRLYASALASLALQTGTEAGSSQAVAKLSQYLAAQQGGDGGWQGDALITAWVVQALVPVSSDAGQRSAAAAFLESKQAANGSWGGDPYITAVALRALTTRPNPAPAPGSISGVVIDANSGAGVEGVTVNTSGSNLSAVTDSLGAYRIAGVAQGSYTVSFSRAGYQGSTVAATVGVSQSLNLGQTSLKPNPTTGIVKGLVTAQTNGAALSGVTVTLSGAASQSVQTDSSGHFEFSSVPVGNITLSASVAGYTTASGSAEIAAGQTLVFSPVLVKVGDPAATTGDFFGQVVNAAGGQPLPSAAVSLTNLSTNAVVTVTPAADGRFTHTLSPGSYAARYTLTGFNTVEQRFVLTAAARVDAGVVALSAIRSVSAVSGKVLDTNGTPISGATVAVIGGAAQSVKTAADGGYAIANAGTTQVTLRASAVGYDSQSVTLQSERPTDMSYTFNLAVQSSSGVAVSQFSLAPASVGGDADLVGAATVVASGSGDVQLVAQYQVRDAQDKTVASGVATVGGIPLGTITLPPSVERSFQFKWNSGQFAAGNYKLVARLLEPGSQSTTNPNGQVLAERSAAFTITSSARVIGSVSANPPVLRAGTGASVALSARLQNGGNVELAADSYKLSVRNTKTNVEVFSASQGGPAMAVNGLGALDFGTWTPTESGDYRLELTSSDPARGTLLGKLYVGDAGSASFKVDKTIVPTGTQRVRASIDVRGQDVANGSISDPLVPQVKAAITKAVNYADNYAYNHYLNDLKCYACHVQTQAIVGGERNLKFLQPLDPLKRSVLMNGVTQYIIDEGSIPYQGSSYKVTNTTLGLWATGEWHGKKELGLSIYKMSKYLMGVQDSQGGWNPDHVSVWWQSKAPYAGLNTGSLTAVARWISGPEARPIEVPKLVPVNTGLPSLPGGDMRLSTAADGTLYIAHQGAQKIWKASPNGSSIELLSNIPVQGARPISGNRLLIAARNGVHILEADGTTLRRISTLDSWDAIELPEGGFMVSPWGGRTIYKLSEAGVQSAYFDSDLFSTSSGTLNRLADGSYLAHGHNGYRFVRFNEQGLVNVPIALTDGRPLDSIPYQGGFLVATESGLFFFNSEWVGERWYTGRVLGVVQMPDGRVLVNAGNQIMEVKRDAVDLAAFKTQLDASIAKSAGWLLSGSQVDTSSNIDLAFQLYGLGRVKAYNGGAGQSAAIDQAINQIATTLRSRQRSDGGWEWRQGAYNNSDPMVTAMVGIALDVLNPSPESPEVRKAVELLLSQQRADGTWQSTNGIATSVPLLTSTWVEIWLPVMLDRLGGIDTVLTLDLPANAQASGFSLTPTTSTALDGGARRLTWKLDGVTSAGRALEFDLDMPGLAPNEVRAAATRAFLTFNNTFSEQPVDLDISVPTVTATAGLGASIATDKASYGPDSPVLISTSVVNNAALVQNASVALKVYAPDGQQIADLGVFQASQLPVSGTQALSAVWNTAQWLAGEGYKVRAQLLDAQGQQVSVSEAMFSVAAPLNLGLGTKILSDKVSYGSNETVTLTDRLVNEVSNTVLEDLVARTSVRGPGGALVWETTQPLAQLVGGSVKELGYRVALGNAVAGRYSATLTVLDAGGQVLSSAATGFDVTSTAASGAGLGGTLSVVGSPVSAGDAAAIQWSVLNKGNSGFDALPVMIRIIDPAGEREVAKLTVGPLALPGGQTIARAQSWTTPATLVDKTLVAVLTAQVGTASIDLAQASFVVTKPPVKLDVAHDIKAGAGGAAKVLVLYDCEPDLGWDLLGWLRLSYTHACYRERAQYLSSYLNSLNVAHYITYDRNAFRRELRSGAYTSIWMLGALPDCGPHLLNEVREAVNRGATLLVDGGTTAYENHALYRLAGARYGGHIWLSTKAMDVSGASFTSTRLSTVGQPLRLSLSGGTVLASYQRQYCYRVDYDGEDNTPHPSGSSYPAVVGNAYGRGKALAFGFDLISALRNGGSDTAAWKRFVTETAGYLKPLDEQRALVAGEMAVFGTTLSNQGSPVGIEARMSLPAAAQVVGTTPQAVLEPGNKVLWKFDLGAGQSVPLQLTLRAPLSTGSYTVGSEMAVVRNGQKQPYASYSQSFNVMDSLAPAKAAYQKLLSLTGVPFLESLNWLSAKVNLDYGIKLYQQGRYHEAVEELGEAANNIRQLSAPLSAERLAVDRLMQEAQYRWYLTQPK